MTYNIYDPVANGVVEAFGFAQAVQKLTPYMQAVMETGAQYSNLQGVVIPIDEKIVYKKKINNNFYDLRTNLFNTAAYVSAMGISYRYSKGKSFNGETVFLFGDAVYIFTDEELKQLFANNNVVVDGGAVLLLKERNLLSLIGAKDARLYPAETGYQAYEQIAGEEEIYGIKGFRASCRLAAGDFVKIDYNKETENKILSHVYNAAQTIEWNAFVQGKNFLINPFVVDKKLYTQFSELRRHFLSNFVEDKAKVLLNTRTECVNPYVYLNEKEAVVMIVNSTLENYDKTEFFIKGVDFNKIISVDKDGVLRETAFECDGGKVRVERPLPYMSTVTFKLVKE